MDRRKVLVQLLAGFRITCGEQVVTSLPSQSVCLLGYLLTNRDRPQTRDLLAGRFWSNLPEDKARKRLSNSLWQIKSTLAANDIPNFIETSTHTVQIVSESWLQVDSDQFKEKLDQIERRSRTQDGDETVADDLADLLTEYPNQFLAGHYEDWIESERLRISDRYTDALNLLVVLLKARGDYERALHFARRLIEEDPLQEDSQREVLRLYALLGQSAAAERQFEECRAVLQKELGVSPNAETLDVIGQVRANASKPPEVVIDNDTETPMVGRTKERRDLLRRVDQLVGGVGGVVLVEGEPGIGKSCLISNVADSAAWRGAKVFSATNSEPTALSPHSGLKMLLEQAMTGLRGEHLGEVLEPVWLNQAAQVLPQLKSSMSVAITPQAKLLPNEESMRLQEALARVILAQGGLGPVVLILEDVHWLDSESMQVLAQLGNRLRDSQVLLCLSYCRHLAQRSNHLWNLLSELEMGQQALRISLGPLAEADLLRLLSRQVAGEAFRQRAELEGVDSSHSARTTKRLSNADLVALTNTCGGNPLFLLETARSMMAGVEAKARRLRRHANGSASSTMSDVSDYPTAAMSAESINLNNSLQARLNELDSETVLVLQIVALIAEPCSSALVAQATGLDRKTVLQSMAAAVLAGFLIEHDDGRCRFSHEQGRLASVESIGPATTELHQKILSALTTQPDGQDRRNVRLDQLAHHAYAGELWTDAYQWFSASARNAVVLKAFQTAAELYRRAGVAAETGAIAARDRVRDLLDFEGVLSVLGLRREQSEVLDQLLGLDIEPKYVIDLAERNCRLLAATDKLQQSIDLASAHVENLRGSNTEAASLLTIVGTAKMWAGDNRGAIEALRRSLELADAETASVEAEIMLGKALVDAMDYGTGDEHLRSALGRAEKSDNIRGQIEALGHLAVSRSRSGKHGEAEGDFDRALGLSRSVGYRHGEGLNLLNLAYLHTVRGRGGLALALFEEAEEVFGWLESGRGEAFVKLNAAELNHRLLGDDCQAERLAAAAAVYFRKIDDNAHEYLALATLSSIDLRRGRRRLAKRRLADALRRAAGAGDVKGEIDLRRGLAEIGFEAQDYASVAKNLDLVIDLSERHGLEVALPLVRSQRAVVANQQGAKTLARDLVKLSILENGAGVERSHIAAWHCAQTLAGLGDENGRREQVELAYNYLTQSLQGLPGDVVEFSWSSIPDTLR